MFIADTTTPTHPNLDEQIDADQMHFAFARIDRDIAEARERSPYEALADLSRRYGRGAVSDVIDRLDRMAKGAA